MLGANDASGQYCLASESSKERRPFICVDCGQAAHLVRRPEYVLFFRHNRKGGCGGEGALHKAVIALLTSNLKLCVPRHPEIQPDVDDAIVEFRVESQNRSIAKGAGRRPDLVVVAATGRFAIEVSVSNALSDERCKWFVDHGLPCIEIDVSDADTEPALAELLFTRSLGRQWISQSSDVLSPPQSYVSAVTGHAGQRYSPSVHVPNHLPLDPHPPHPDFPYSPPRPRATRARVRPGLRQAATARTPFWIRMIKDVVHPGRVTGGVIAFDLSLLPSAAEVWPDVLSIMKLSGFAQISPVRFRVAYWPDVADAMCDLRFLDRFGPSRPANRQPE